MTDVQCEHRTPVSQLRRYGGDDSEENLQRDFSILKMRTERAKENDSKKARANCIDEDTDGYTESCKAKRRAGYILRSNRIISQRNGKAALCGIPIHR